MGGQKFQYDESGGTFFYFLLSFLALLLIPGTYYWWPRKEKEGKVFNKVLMWHNLGPEILIIFQLNTPH